MHVHSYIHWKETWKGRKSTLQVTERTDYFAYIWSCSGVSEVWISGAEKGGERETGHNHQQLYAWNNWLWFNQSDDCSYFSTWQIYGCNCIRTTVQQHELAYLLSTLLQSAPALGWQCLPVPVSQIGNHGTWTGVLDSNLSIFRSWMQLVGQRHQDFGCLAVGCCSIAVFPGCRTSCYSHCGLWSVEWKSEIWEHEV